MSRTINKKKMQIAALVLMDILFSNGAMFLGLFIRFEMSISEIPAYFIHQYHMFLYVNTIITFTVFFVLGLYDSLWKFAGFGEAVTIVAACTIVLVLDLAGCYAVGCVMPRSAYAIMFMVFVILTVANRFAYRGMKWIRTNSFQSVRGLFDRGMPGVQRNIMVIGAGNAGSILIKEIENSAYLENNKVVCVIDDDHEKIGRSICGIRVVGDRNVIPMAASKFNVQEIIFAIPSLSTQERAKILNICKDTTCVLKTVPGVYQLVNGEVKLNNVRHVVVEDLLGREPIRTDMTSVLAYVQNKVVMVTGGGGSIGSELCRQIAAHKPKQLIIFDIYENNAYDIQNELKRKYPELELVTLIGSVRDTKRIDGVFLKYRPQIIYHAAAHKHVPLMEESPNEAIKNNVFGTYKTALCADKYRAEKFVLISTDKAVNPTNIMGASKRMCEMIVQGLNEKSTHTDFVAVRFGNVLGSNGSVIPLFERQIKEGGPVTVTHPDIIRYFMTIPEAVALVLQAGAYAKGGEIFILDMGKPVKILDLAKNVIRLNGYVPEVDIPIVFTGLRPGEKLYEELLMDEEGIQETDNKLIHIGKPIEFDTDRYFRDIESLRQIMMDDSKDIRVYIKQIVPTYITPAEANGKKINVS